MARMIKSLFSNSKNNPANPYTTNKTIQRHRTHHPKKNFTPAVRLRNLYNYDKRKRLEELRFKELEDDIRTS